MSAIQIYVYVSTILFVFLAVMLRGSSSIGMMLKACASIMAMFGFALCLAVSGVILSNGVRLL